MKNEDLVRLHHMLDSSKAILSFLKGRKRRGLDTDRMLSSAVLREFEIIGEAAGKISQKTKSRFSELPWKQMIGMRNRLIHAYFDISNDIIWKTAKELLPSFCSQLEEIISTLEIEG